MPELEPGFLLYVGGIDHRKNVEGLLEAYARLPEELAARHQLVIAFQLPSGRRAELVAFARALGIDDRLYLPGYVDDATLIAAYQSTDLFVFPSRYEGYGLPVAEAMACGALCVSSDTSSVAELTAPEGRFDPEDSEAMAAVIEKALTDPPTRAALEAVTRRPPRRWAAAAAAAAEVYEELLGG
jgi:glycosyltransferase involved in cell wall biosynthesis